MSAKTLVSKASPRLQRQNKGKVAGVRTSSGRSSTTTTLGTRGRHTKTYAKRGQVMISLRELASAYPGRKIPMLVVDNIETPSRRVSTGLVIDAKRLSRALPGLGYRLDESKSDTAVSREDMLDLDQVQDVLRTAGRSTVHAMEASNRIFGLLPPGRMRGKWYPSWQFDRAIAGDSLRQILAELDSVDAWGKYQFFTSAYPELGHLTPIEVLTARVDRSEATPDETRALIQAPYDRRLSLIVDLAKEFAHPS
jgi:hypothetical protein